MNRKISLSIEDIYIKYAGEAFGATGSHNALTLRMIFGSAWDGTAKTAYFTDALGSASVSIVLGLDKLVGGAYEVDVPSEALKYAGEATVTIKGVLTSGDTTTKAITTAAGHFRVLDSELPESAGNAGTITPSDKEQLQAEIAGMETLFTTAKAAAEAAAANAKVSETNAKTSETAAASSASSAEASKTAAAESATTATAQASAADASAAKSAASQKAAQAAETNAKASEKAAAESQASAETAAASAQDSAAAAAKSAQTAQGASSAATNAASSANQSATAASGSASQAQASAAAAAQSAVSVDGINKTAQSWAVGGTGTRPGEDTDNAKYWAEQAQAVVGGDFATKVEAQGYVTAHNQDTTAHADIRAALAGKETAGAAATVQSNLTAHAGNTTVHVTAEQKTAWNGKASKPKACLVTLKSSGWDSGVKTQTVTVDGILADEATQRVLALPAVASAAAYRDAGICMTARETGTVTFSTKTVPSESLKVWVSWESVEDVTPPLASVAPQSGVNYTAGLSGLEASDVTAFAQAISNCSDVTNETTAVYVDHGDVHRKISVGDQVTLPLNGTNYAFDVIGFNHDELTTPTAYGAATVTGKAGITFQMHDLFNPYFAMNDSMTNNGGWKSSKMRTSTMVTMKGYLPSAWQAAIKPVNKASGTGGGSSSGTETVSDSCFLLAEVEIFGKTRYSVTGEGTQYAYYKAGNSKVKNKNGSAYVWVERSPHSGESGTFCGVTHGGNADYGKANNSFGVAFGFCV